MAEVIHDRQVPGGITRGVPWDPNNEQPYDWVNPQEVSLAGQSAPLEVHSMDWGNGTVSKAQFSIPAAGNYTAGDIVSGATGGGTAWRFKDCARANGEGFYITGMRMVCDEDSITVMQPRCHFFRREPTGGSVREDNVAKGFVIADMQFYLGYIDLPVFADIGTMSATQNQDVRMKVTPDPRSRDLFMVFETLGAETNETAGMLIMAELDIDWI